VAMWYFGEGFIRYNQSEIAAIILAINFFALLYTRHSTPSVQFSGIVLLDHLVESSSVAIESEPAALLSLRYFMASTISSRLGKSTITSFFSEAFGSHVVSPRSSSLNVVQNTSSTLTTLLLQV
jgi:hypothetical protein